MAIGAGRASPRRIGLVGLVVVAALGGPGCRSLPPARPGAEVPPVAAPKPRPTPEAAPAKAEPGVIPASHQVEAARLPTIAPPDAEPPPPEGVLTLPEAIAYGLRFNPRLQQAAAQIRIAREGETIAFAPFLPDANFNYVFAGFNRPVLPGGQFVPASLQRGVYTFSLAEAGIQWTLLDFGRRAGRYGQALNRTNIEGLIFRRARQSVAFEVASGYFALLQARAQERVLVEAVRRSDAFRQDAGSRREGGTVERDTLFRSDVQVSRSTEELAAGRQAVLDAEAILNQSLGRSCGGPVEVVDIGRRPPFGEPREACLARAATVRPEIGAARQEIAAAASGIRSSRGELLPKVYVRGTVIQADLPPFFNGIVDGAGVNVEQPIYGGGKRIAGLRVAEETAMAAAAGLRVILINVSTEVNLAHNAIATTQERIRLGATGARLARENLRVVVVRFNNGDALAAEVIEAETALTGAEVGYYASVYGYLANLARLEYAQGVELDPLVAAAMGPPASPEERVALPRDEPGDRPIPEADAPPGTISPGPPPPEDGLPAALPGPPRP